jgi:chromosomal replication initiator protein
MDYKKLWKKTKESLKQVLPDHGYEAWIETLSPVGATSPK